MPIKTHQAIDRELCGRPLQVDSGSSVVELVTLPCMAADASGLVHGGFVFGLADYAAMVAVNDPNVVLGAADVKFLKPVCVGETVRAQAETTAKQGKKHMVTVEVRREDEPVFQGTFTCFVLENHILGSPNKG